MNGWIKLHRKMLDNPLMRKPARLSVWITLLLLASHDTDSFMFNGKKSDNKPGQLITGRRKLKNLCGLPESTIEDTLNYLEMKKQIRQQKTTKYRVITILNWELYQKPDNKAQKTRHNQEVIQEEEYTEQSSETVITKKTMKKTIVGKYNESDSSDSYEKQIDLDTGTEVVIAPKAGGVFKQLLVWAENERGFKFMSVPKQYKAFTIAKKFNIEPYKLQERWIDFSTDKFWSSKGYDWMDVVLSFNKKP